MCRADLDDFRQPGMERRILRGGLPPFFLADRLPDKDFQEWMDAYWAKDIQELFRVEKRAAFLKFAELLLTRSGGMFEATAFTGPCEVSRPTIAGYLAILEETFVVHVLRPFSSRRATEIISAPRVYAFDTGFACHYRDWTDLRPDDFGVMWEHIVLNEIHAATQERRVNYWRDKVGHEMDFVLHSKGRPLLAIECKRTASNFDPANTLAFARLYPLSRFMVVASDVKEPFKRKYGEFTVSFAGLDQIEKELG
jgi:predicted AAA+ superfamily ATPase